MALLSFDKRRNFKCLANSKLLILIMDSTVAIMTKSESKFNGIAWARRFNNLVLHPFRFVYRLVKNPHPWANLCHLAGSQGRRRAACRCLAGLIWRLVGASFTTLPFSYAQFPC